jgi:DNA-binding NtrC family response regulator
VEDRKMAPELIGKSAAMQAVRTLVRQSARRTDPVLIVGPLGSGKALTAQLIHALSERRTGPYEMVHCAAVAETIFETTLFGLTGGGFGREAHVSTPGVLERVDGGTIFLNEVSQLPRSLQSKLLHFLKTGEFCRVGETAVRRANVRVLASTFRSFSELVEAGELREDLYQLLSTVLITMPPLHERLEDIELLANHFVALLGPSMGHPRVSFTSGAITRLAEKRFFGNVRDLQMHLEHMLHKAPAGDLLIDEARVAGEWAFALNSPRR